MIATNQDAWKRHRAKMLFLGLENGQLSFSELLGRVMQRYPSLRIDREFLADLRRLYLREAEGRREWLRRRARFIVSTSDLRWNFERLLIFVRNRRNWKRLLKYPAFVEELRAEFDVQHTQKTHNERTAR